MKRRTLIIKHDVIRTGYAHDESHLCSSQQSHQVIHIILISFSVIGITHVTTEWHA